MGEGPNAGLGYFLTEFQGGGWENYLHPGLLTPPVQSNPQAYTQWEKWHVDQNGAGSGTCTQAVFPTLVSEVERHEGITMSADSHYGVALLAYRELSHLRLAQDMEEIYTQGTEDDVRFRGQDVWMRYHQRSDYARRQADYDNKDRPLILQRIKCTIDVNPGDK